jgi:hypothetical protein
MARDCTTGAGGWPNATDGDVASPGGILDDDDDDDEAPLPLLPRPWALPFGVGTEVLVVVMEGAVS